MPLLESIAIENYRLFNRFTADGFTRVNLLVGRNNSGKSALLEAIESLVGEGSASSVLAACRRRAETRRPEDASVGSLIDVSHLFHGHTARVGSSFELTGRSGDRESSLTWKVVAGAALKPDQATLFQPLPSGQEQPASAILIEASPRSAELAVLPLESGEIVDRRLRPWLGEERRDRPTVRTIPPSGLDLISRAQHWDRIALTEEADRAIAAMQTIAPGLLGVHFAERGRAFVRLAEHKEKIPLGSLGEGTSRLLGIAITLGSTAGGYVLADEVDTGLHHSVLTDLWRLVVTTARRLDIQIFATTHSLDCVNALAWLVETEKDLGAATLKPLGDGPSVRAGRASV